MKIVVDTNRIISAAIAEGTTRQILVSGRFEFLTIEHAVVELKKHKALIAEKSGLSEKRIDDLFDLLLAEIYVVEEKTIMAQMGKSEALMGDVDPADVPFLACALATGADAIWSHDKHFNRQKAVRVVTNADLIG